MISIFQILNLEIFILLENILLYQVGVDLLTKFIDIVYDLDKRFVK